MVRQLGDSEDVDEVEEKLEERRALLALPTSADDRQLRDDRARSGRHAASIGERSRMARGAPPRAIRTTTRRCLSAHARPHPVPADDRVRRGVVTRRSTPQTLASRNARRVSVSDRPRKAPALDEEEQSRWDGAALSQPPYAVPGGASQRDPIGGPIRFSLLVRAWYPQAAGLDRSSNAKDPPERAFH